MPYKTKTGRIFKSKPGPKRGKRKRKKKCAGFLTNLGRGFRNLGHLDMDKVCRRLKSTYL